MNNTPHISVMLSECIENLNIKEDGIYVDCTLGFAGHSKEILKRIKKGHLFAFDQDNEAIAYSRNALAEISDNFTIIKSNFVNLKKELKDRGIEKIDGILFDLGVSSLQLDKDERGFSFHTDSALDMRMNQDSEFSAYNLVNEYSEEEITKILYQYGEEKYARSIARNICVDREIKPIETTLELVEVIKKSVPEKYKRKGHPGRKTFQAIRISVNKELEVFESAIKDAIDMLNHEGRACVISFHSLEDRICKSIFKELNEVDPKVKGLPVIPEEYQPDLSFIKRIKPTKDEIERNKRSRSAVLRVAEKR